MMDKSSRNIKLGVFIVLISLIFAFVVYKVSGGRGLLNNSIRIYAEFDNVEGLLTGNSVRYSGVNIGTVTEIKIVSDTILKVTMSLDKNIKNYVKSNAEADISTNGLVGNMLVNITPGKGHAPLIKDGDIIPNKKSADLADMLGTLSSTNDKIAQITDALLQITKKINNGTGSISQLINDGSLANNLRTTTQNFSISSQNIKTSTDSINSMIMSAAQGNGNLGYLFKDDSFKTQMSQLSQNLDSLINDRVEPIVRNLETSSLAIVATSEELESLIKDLGKNDGLLGTLMKDTSITNDLKTTMQNLNDGTQKFDQSMEAIQHHWLLRGFFKDKKEAAKKAEEKKKEELAKSKSQEDSKN